MIAEGGIFEARKISRYSFGVLQNRATKFLSELKNPPKITACDHVCYVVKSQERFDKVFKHLSERGKVVHELEKGQFKGTRFLIFQMDTPAKFNGHKFQTIELKYAEDEELEEGFQHVEYIIEGTLQKLVEENPNINWETGKMVREKNKEVGVLMSVAKMIGIKFRERPLLEPLQ